MQSSVHHLSFHRADPDVFGQRGLAKGVTVKHPDFWDAYDNDTLIYDAIWSATERKIRVFFPKLINFEPIIQRAKWIVDGKPIQPRKFRHFRIYDTLELHCDRFSGDLRLVVDGHTVDLSTSEAAQDRYRGKRVIYTQVKNDKLDWVADWARAHQRNHGVDAVLVTNNNSTDYTSEELRATLAQIEGLAIADVLEVPLRYRPNPRLSTNSGLTGLQQMTLLNLVRHRWFGQAAGVLLCDVDELVVSLNGQSIFEATQRSFFKFLRFDGEWRYAPSDVAEFAHADHVYKKTTPDTCISKYCIVPDSWLGRTSWGVHTLSKVNRRLFPATRRFQFLHCKGINTSWKWKIALPAASELQIDEATQRFMADTYPEPRVTDM